MFQAANIKSDRSFSIARKATRLNPTPSRTITEEDIGRETREPENASLL
jgi:hypothetical protein